MVPPTPASPARRVLILSFSPIASDARVLKQVALLAERYDVVTCGYGVAPIGVAEHIRVPDELAIWRYPRLAVVLRRYRSAYWGNAAIDFVRTALRGRRFDIVLADDVDAVPLALSLKPSCGVHADLHEYSPRQHDELPRFRWFVKPFIEWICRRYVTRAASTTTVSASIAREYERRFGFRPEVVTNAAPYVEAVPTPPHTPLRIVHSGAALRNRHLETLIDAITGARPGVTLDLFLTANDAAYLAELREIVAAADGRVRLHDPVPYAQLAETLRGFDIGIHVLPPVNVNNEWALPNKIFDYVQARLAVLVGPSPEMADYVRRYGIGVVTDGFGADDVRRAVDELDAAAVARMKAAASSSARELSSEDQVRVWDRAIAALAAR